MKIKNLKWIIALSVVALLVSACGNSNATLTPPLTRAATQTPWIIYMPVTNTPEPTILPLLPTVEVKTTSVPTRTPTRTVVKPTVVPTKPVVVAPSVAKPTATPACSIGTVNLREPENNASRHTKAQGGGGDTFRFIWDPPASLQGLSDPQVGYKIAISSQRAGFSNGATLYVSHNKYWNDKVVILDKPAVTTLASGDDVNVTWNVTIVRTSGSFNDNDLTVVPPGLVTCGPSSPTWTISLQVYD